MPRSLSVSALFSPSSLFTKGGEGAASAGTSGLAPSSNVVALFALSPKRQISASEQSVVLLKRAPI